MFQLVPNFWAGNSTQTQQLSITLAGKYLAQRKVSEWHRSLPGIAQMWLSEAIRSFTRYRFKASLAIRLEIKGSREYALRTHQPLLRRNISPVSTQPE